MMSVMTGVEGEDRIQLGRQDARTVRRRSFRLLGSLLRPQRARVVWLAVVILVAQGAKAAGPLILSIAIDQALPRVIAGDERWAWWSGGAYVLAGVLAAVAGWQGIMLTARVSQNALLDLRRRVFLQVQRLDLGFHETYTSGRAISRQTSDLDSIRELLDGGVNQLLSSFVYMAFVAVTLVSIDPVSGLVLAVAVLPVVLVTRWFHRVSQVHYRRTRVASANLIVQFVETITGIRAVQAFRREAAVTAEHTRLADEYRSADQRALAANGTYDPALVLIGNVTVAVMLAVDGLRVAGGHIAIGVLIAAVLYAKQFFTPVEQMARFYNSLQSAVASLEKISGLLEQRSAVTEPVHPRALPSGADVVELDAVTFRYPSADAAQPAQLRDVTVRIPAGQVVALVGSTGAGKSTVAKLVARFYDPSAGQVRIGGVDLREVADDQLRRSVVLVTQEAYLFSGTIAENIAMGRPGASRDEIERAAGQVGLDEFVRGLPDGYDTDLGQRGARLSAGQRQLLSFARAVLADPQVLILDEATSSLDLPGEALVQRALHTLLAGRTAVIIAHRLSTVEVSDRVLVIESGRIVEDGAPAELVAAGGRYAELHAEWVASTGG